MKILIMLVSLLISSFAFAGGCIQNQSGKTVCTDGDVYGNPPVVRYGSTSNRSAVTIQNSAGVNHTYGSRGGQAVTKNGKGVVQGPGGTTCAKGRYNSGCR